jgi:hypothetical protein
MHACMYVYACFGIFCFPLVYLVILVLLRFDVSRLNTGIGVG